MAFTLGFRGPDCTNAIVTTNVNDKPYLFVYRMTSVFVKFSIPYSHDLLVPEIELTELLSYMKQ